MSVLNFYHIGKIIPENAVYIGRGNRKLNLEQSLFANPFPMSSEMDRDTVIGKYRTWLWDKIKTGNITNKDLIALRGKDLVCYCSPKSCHGDILEKAIEWAYRQESTKFVNKVKKSSIMP